MLDQIKTKLSEEKTQRDLLKGVKLVTVFIAANVFTSLANKAADGGINALMAKLHPTNETPTA